MSHELPQNRRLALREAWEVDNLLVLEKGRVRMEKPNRRFGIEELNNGWLVKITETQSDKFIARYAFINLAALLEFIRKELSDGKA